MDCADEDGWDGTNDEDGGEGFTRTKGITSWAGDQSDEKTWRNSLVCVKCRKILETYVAVRAIMFELEIST